MLRSKEIHKFNTFYQKILSPGVGVWKYKKEVSYPYKYFIHNLVKIGPVVLEKKMLTHDERRIAYNNGLRMTQVT